MTLVYGSYFLLQTILKKCTSLKINKRSIKSWSVVFFGSDNFSLQSLHALNKNLGTKKIKNLEVVTVNNKNPIYHYAVSHSLKIYLWPPVLSGPYDFGVIVSFGKFIPKKILNQFPLGIINVHASLLPRWRGGMPIVHAIKNGDISTGITVIRINCDKFDAGEVILMKSLSIGKDEVMPSLHKKLRKLGSECLLEVINCMPKCLENAKPQSSENMTLAPVLKKDSAIVKWGELTAGEVYNLYRGFFGLFDLKTKFAGLPLKLMCMSLNESEAEIGEDEPPPPPGSVRFDKTCRFLIVQCKERSIKVCTVLYKAKLYSAHNFYGGFLAPTSKSLWRFES